MDPHDNLEEGREWRRQRRAEYRRSPEGRREAWVNLVKDLTHPFLGMAALLFIFALLVSPFALAMWVLELL